MSEPSRVVVADDHPLFREGVVNSLRSSVDVAIFAEAADADRAVQAMREGLPDVVLLDVTMPGDGISAAELLEIVKSIRAGDVDVAPALAAGLLRPDE